MDDKTIWSDLGHSGIEKDVFDMGDVRDVNVICPKPNNFYNYNRFKNKPQINGVTLEGNKTTEELGIHEYDDTEIREMISDIEDEQEVQDTNIANNAEGIEEINRGLVNYSLVNETGYRIDLEMDSQTFDLVAKLYDKNGNLLSTSSDIDLPLESLVVSVEYDSVNKEIVITLESGEVTRVPVGDLVEGLVSVEDLEEALEGYYTKTETDNLLSPINSDISDLQDDIDGLQGDIDSINDEQTTQNENIAQNAADISTLNDDLANYSLITETGSQVALTLDNTNYKMKVILKDKNGDTIYTSNEIDLPMESVVINGFYDNTTKEVVLTLVNGSTIRFSVASLVSGLVSDEDLTTILGNYYTSAEIDTLLVDYVKNNDYATSEKGGVIKTATGAGTNINSNGALIGVTRSYSNYQNDGASMFISKGTLENVIEGKELINQSTLDESQAEQDINIEDNRKDIDFIEDLIDQFDTVDGAGTDLELDDTAEYKMAKLDMLGNSSQFSTEGYNISNFTRLSSSGITYSGNEITIINPTTRYLYGTNYWNLVNNSDLSGKTYTFYVLANGSTGAYDWRFLVAKTGNSYAINKSYSANSNFNNDVYVGQINLQNDEIIANIRVEAATLDTNTNLSLKIMVVEGSYTVDTIPPYEPYTNGVAPNPDYPQDVKSVTGDNSLILQNENLLKCSLEKMKELNNNGTWSGNSYTKNGLTLTYNDDKSITVTGTSTDRTIYYISEYLDFIKDTTYTTLDTSLTMTSDYYYYYDGSSNVGLTWGNTAVQANMQLKAFTPNQTGNMNLRLQINSGVTINKTFKPMVVKGGVTTLNIPTYVPHEEQNYQLTLKSNNIIGLDTRQYHVDLKAGDKITITNNSSGTLNLNFYTNYGDETRNDNWSVQAGVTRTVTVGYDSKAIAWSSAPSGGLAWVNLGTTSLPYEPYTENPIELNSSPDETVRDAIIGTPDNWYKREYIYKFIMKGTESWNKYSTNRYYLSSSSAGALAKLRGGTYCTHFKWNTNQSLSLLNNCIYIASNGGNIEIYPSQEFLNEYDTYQKFKSWLATQYSNNNPVIAYYQRTEPVDIPITDTTLINQLNDIYKNAHSYNGVTNITTTYEDGNEQMYLDASAIRRLSGYVTEDELSDYVKNTDYAKLDGSAGVVKANGYYDIVPRNDGNLCGVNRNYNYYSNTSPVEALISKGTLENVITGKELINQTTLNESQAEQDVNIEENASNIEELQNIVDQLPHETGEGTDIELEPTIEAKMSIGEFGNSSQFSTTGKAKMNILLENGESSQTINNLTTSVEDYTVTVNGTPSAAGGAWTKYTTLPAGTYKLCSKYISGSFTQDTGTTPYSQFQFIVNDGTNNLTNGGFTTNNYTGTFSSDFTLTEEKEVRIRYYFGSANNPVYNNLKLKLQIIEGTTADYDFEPYTDGSAPNPSYPYPVKNVTGENEIVVQNENLLNIVGTRTHNGVTTTGTSDGKMVSVGTTGSNAYFNMTENYKPTNILAGDYIFSIQSAIAYGLQIILYDANQTKIIDGTINRGSTNINITISSDASYYRLAMVSVGSGASVDVTLNPMLRLSTVADNSFVPHEEQDYQLSLGDIELNSSPDGAIRDAIVGSSAISYNLFNKNDVFKGNYQINSSQILISSNSNRTLFIPCKPNTTYTVSKKISNYFTIGFINEEPGVNISVTGYMRNASLEYLTSTSDSDSKYLACWYYNTGETLTEQEILDSIQITEGSEVKPYFPYGQKGMWCKREYIGKVVLDGSEYWSISGTNTSGYNRFTSGVIYNLINKPSSTSQVVDILSNYFIKKSADNTYQRINGISVGTNGNLYIYDDDFKEYTVEQFKTWLSTHNTTVYYPLAQYTDIPITDTTLISQLNDIYENAKSYNGTTNITSTYEDGNEQMIIEASAIRQADDYVTDDDLVDYVKNTDYATSSKGGVVKTAPANYGTVVDPSGYLSASKKTYQEYISTSDYCFIGKGTLENVIVGKDLTTKAYVDGLVGDISDALDAINGENLEGGA